MTHKLYFISDIEMGRGDITDDFSDDDMLAKFISNIQAANNEKATLILNGDIFDFLKMAYKEKYPRYITEDISLWKLNEAIKSHPKVFEALKEWLKNRNHYLHFVIGNHDADLVWPSLQKRLRDELITPLKNNSSIKTVYDQVSFDFWYKNDKIHAEHGHFYDPYYSHNPKKPIITYRGKRILNLPWGTYACFTHLNKIKQLFPKEERLYPKPLALEQNLKFKKESKKTTAKLVIQTLIFNPLLYLFNPTHRAPYIKLFNHILNHGFEFLDDNKFVDRTIRKAMAKNPDKEIIVLGHSHLEIDKTRKNRRAFVTDTWRDEHDLTNGSIKKPKTYVEIIHHKEKPLVANLKRFETRL